MPALTHMSVREATALAERLTRKGSDGTLAGQVAVLETDGRTASRLIQALLKHVNPSDVFQLPPEA
jgi:hypothetical protein